MRESGVYAIRHIATGRCYVGSSVAIPYRWRQHRQQLSQGRHHSRHLQRAWDKYGASAFEFVVLEHVEPSNLIAREQYHIDATASASRSGGFNVLVRAGTTLGSKLKPCSEERKRKIGAANSGKSPGAETRAKQAAAKLGRKLSAETRARMSATQRAWRARQAAERPPKPDLRHHRWMTREEVALARNLRSEGMSITAIGARLGFTKQAISGQLKGRCLGTRTRRKVA